VAARSGNFACSGDSFARHRGHFDKRLFVPCTLPRDRTTSCPQSTPASALDLRLPQQHLFHAGYARHGIRQPTTISCAERLTSFDCRLGGTALTGCSTRRSSDLHYRSNAASRKPPKALHGRAWTTAQNVAKSWCAGHADTKSNTTATQDKNDKQTPLCCPHDEAINATPVSTEPLPAVSSNLR